MKKKFLIWGIAFILIILLNQFVFAENTKETGAQESLQIALESMDPREELIHFRAANQRAFKDKAGKVVTFISTEPLNYATEDGHFHPIDTNITFEIDTKYSRTLSGSDIGENKYGYSVLKNSLKSWFANESDGGMKLEYDQYSVEFFLVDSNKSKANIDKNKINYEKVFTNCDLVYTVMPGQVKDEFVFYTTPQTPIISYKLKMNQKLVPEKGPDGSIELVDQTGRPIFQLLASSMYEKDNPDEFKVVETKFHWNGDELYCDLILDMSWLKDKNRQYPIIVDPIVTPAPVSSGKTTHRTLIHCPETNGTIKCTIKLDGPHWHGDLSRHDRAEVYFRDQTTGEYFLYHYGTDSYNPKPYETSFIADHDYEVYLYAGQTKRIDGKTYNGQAWAVIEYGDENGSLFAKTPKGHYFTGINNEVVLKNIFIKYPQTVKYRYVKETSSESTSRPYIPYFRITPGYTILPPDSNSVIEGEIQLNAGYYQLELSPGTKNDYRVELEFPLATGAYERKIVLRTNPGSIESTFMLPSTGDVCLQYHTIQNDLSCSNKAYPNIKITSGSEPPIIDKNFPLDYYHIYDGGNKVKLTKEKLYTLTVSRGRSSGGGWGSVNLDFFYPENVPCEVNSLQLIDQNGNPVEGEYASPDYGLRFSYQDSQEENHTLKAYKLYLCNDEYPINNLNAGNGWITVPYSINDFGLYSGTTFQGIIKAYDGFDISDSGLGNFTVDGAKPVIDGFTGEVTIEDGINCLNLTCHAQDVLSGIQTGVISWKVQDQTGGTIPWSDGKNTYFIPDLPANAEVEVTFSVTDKVENTATLTKTFYTYPEEADLVAPVAVHTSNPGKYHPILKFNKTEAPEYRIQRFLCQNGQSDILEYDTGYIDADTLSTVTIQPPGLNIISPSNGASFGRPAHITLTALTDQLSEVYKVDFYANGEFIDSVTENPFRTLWRDVEPGTYTVTALATDLDGLTQAAPPVTIEVTNALPQVRIVNPVSGDSFSQPANIYIMVEATDSDGDIVKVDFYNNDSLLGSDTTSPYSIIWRGVPVGDYTLTARATDNNDALSTSDPIAIYVTNEKPTASISAPKNNDIFIQPVDITIIVNANDNDGSITTVEFYANNKLIGLDKSSPYSYTWTNVPAGKHSLKVRVIDNDGAETWTGERNIDVVETPDNMWYGMRTRRVISSFPISYEGYWEEVLVTDNVNNSENQWFFYEDIRRTFLYIDGNKTDVQSIYTTNYWVPRDVTVYNYARNDDDFYIYLNGKQVFFNTYSNDQISSKKITLALKGQQWNQVKMVVYNNGGGDHELLLKNNFKYLIQRELSSGEKVYMWSGVSTNSTSSLSIVDGEASIPTNQSYPGMDAVLRPSMDELMQTDSPSTSYPLTTEEYYSYLDLLPVEPHQTYVYRITTRNGEQTATQDSSPVLVMNNPPIIRGVEPNCDTVSHSNGSFSIRVTDVLDYDGDPMKNIFEITGPVTRVSSDPKAREFIVENLPDGEYSWTVRAEDNFGGADTVSGTIIVDKETPTALFSLNNGAFYTVEPRVQLVVSEVTETVEKIRISNDRNTWTEYPGSNQTIEWDLSNEDGRKVVYLQAYKPAGETWGPVVERSITLDRNGPNVSNLRISPTGGEGKVIFSWLGGSDNTSGLSGKVRVQRLENGAWDAYETDYEKNRIEIPTNGFNTPVEIRLQLMDNAGNLSAWSEPAVGYTKAAPGSFNHLETTSGYSNIYGHYIALKLNPADGAVNYKIECVQNPGGGDSAFIGDDLFYKDQAVLPHQTYKYRVLTYNSSGEITESSVTEFTVANTPPVKPVGIVPQGLLNQANGLVFSFDQPLEILDPNGDSLSVTYLLSTDGEEYTELATNIPSNLQEGVTYWWKAIIDDGYDGGVVVSDPVNFVIDQTAPSITLDNHSTEYALEHLVRVTVSDSGSGIEKLIINGTQTTDPHSELIFDTHGVNYLDIEAYDQAGNTATFTNTYYVDREPPSCINLSFDLPEEKALYLASSNVIPVVWQSEDAETGIAQFKYSWSGESDQLNDLVLLGAAGTYTANLVGDFVDGQTYSLSLQAINHLGLSSMMAQSPQLLYDQTGPILSISPFFTGTLFNGVHYFRSINELSLDVSAVDPHTGISKIEYALVENPATDLETQWFSSLGDLKENITVTDGKVYNLAVRAYNGTKLTKTVFSEAMIIDRSEPDLKVVTPAEQNDNQVYMGQVQVRDEESTVVRVEYSIGTKQGGTNLSTGLPGVNTDGWLTIEYPEANFEIRQYDLIPVGTTYYITVKATNSSGVTTVQSSSGTKVIASNGPIVRDDGTYTSDRNSLHFEWSFPNPSKELKDYQYRIRSEEETIIDWCFASGAESVLEKELDLAANKRYFCDVQAIYEDGSISEIGSTDGILIDITEPEITEFILPKYAAGDGIELSWAARDPESGIKCYAGIGSGPGGTEVSEGWIYLGNSRKFRLIQDAAGENIEFTHKQRYYVTIMVQNGAGLAVQQTGTPVLVDLTPPEPVIVIDEGNYTNRADQLKFSWKWPLGNEESGIKEYWFALTTQQAINGSEEWYTSYQEKEILLEGLELIQGGVYYLAVKAINNAGLESVGFSDGILVDTTAPTPPMVIDYGDFSLSKSELKVSMIASDAESGIAEYRLSLGTLEDPDRIFGDRTVMSSGGMEHLNLTGLNLEEGQVYIFTVSAVNQAGIVSMFSTSDGIMVDSKQPVVQAVNVQGRYLTDCTRLVFDWTSEPTPSGLIDAEYAISEDPNGKGLRWQPADLSGSQSLNGLQLEEGKTYYVFVRVQNRALAENTPAIWSNPKCSSAFSIDSTPPEILNIYTPALMPQRFLLQWEGRDDVSGITEYRYAVGSYRRGTDVTDGWRSISTQQTTVSFYLDDLPLHNNHDCYISVMAKNGAGLWSPVYTSAGIKTELTPPVVTKFSYLSAFLNCKDLKDGIHLDWAADDPESGIAAYRFCFVTDKNKQNLDDAPKALTNQTSGVIHLTEFDLVDGGRYYLAFQAQNSLGAWSEVTHSGEILVDLTSPVVSVVKEVEEFVTNDGIIDLTWLLSEAGHVEYKLTYPNGYETEPETVAVAVEHLHSFELPIEIEGVYTLELKPIDLAGNPGDLISEAIRLNAKPIANPGPDRRVFKGGTVIFTPEVSDGDGTIAEYFWDFGNDETSSDIEPTCDYQELGEYLVTLRVMDNDGKWSEPGTAKIIVSNTTGGELTMDEDWEGDADIIGDIIVPQGVTLKIKAGTMIDFLGEYQFIVYGRILIEGTAEQPVLIGKETETWGGIRLISADPGSTLRYTQIYTATTGLVVAESDMTVEDCLFAHNRIGIHALNSAPLFKGCIFQENMLYGVKEDDEAAPTVIECSFVMNPGIDYYEDQLGIIGMEQLNGLVGNKANTVIK